MKIIMLASFLTISALSQTTLNLTGGYYHYKKESIVFECLEDLSKTDICKSAQAILIKKKPKENGEVKAILAKGKYLSFNQENIHRIENRIRMRLKQNTTKFSDFYMHGTYGGFMLGFMFPCVYGTLPCLIGVLPSVAVTSSVGILADLAMIPIRLTRVIKEKIKKKRQLSHESTKEQVLNNHKKIKVTQEIFEKLKEALELN